VVAYTMSHANPDEAAILSPLFWHVSSAIEVKKSRIGDDFTVTCIADYRLRRREPQQAGFRETMKGEIKGQAP
jgi:hypothetical protein